MNPLAYLLISLQFTSLMLAIIFLIAFFNFGRRQYALVWSIAFFVATVQWVLNLGSPLLFDDKRVYWLVVSATSILTLILALVGHRQRVGLPNPPVLYLGVGLAVESAIAYFTIADPHNGLRMAIGPAFGALMVSLCAVTLLRNRQRVLPAEWGTIAVMAIFALCEASAAIAILGGGAEGSAAAQARYAAINFLSLPAAYTGMGMFTVLILASDMSREMKSLALMDPLTHLLNLRGFEEAAGRSILAVDRSGQTLSVLLCDIDHFKSINDRYGHATGDEALRRVALQLSTQSRAQDIVGRLGGEEFVVLLPDASLDVACAIAERLRSALAALRIPTMHGGETFGLTASFGVAALEPGATDIDSLLRRADKALYRSKHEGRDRVTAAHDGSQYWQSNE